MLSLLECRIEAFSVFWFAVAQSNQTAKFNNSPYFAVTIFLGKRRTCDLKMMHNTPRQVVMVERGRLQKNTLAPLK